MVQLYTYKRLFKAIVFTTNSYHNMSHVQKSYNLNPPFFKNTLSPNIQLLLFVTWKNYWPIISSSKELTKGHHTFCRYGVSFWGIVENLHLHKTYMCTWCLRGHFIFIQLSLVLSHVSLDNMLLWRFSPGSNMFV